MYPNSFTRFPKRKKKRNGNESLNLIGLKGNKREKAKKNENEKHANADLDPKGWMNLLIPETNSWCVVADWIGSVLRTPL